MTHGTLRKGAARLLPYGTRIAKNAARRNANPSSSRTASASGLEGQASNAQGERRAKIPRTRHTQGAARRTARPVGSYRTAPVLIGLYRRSPQGAAALRHAVPPGLASASSIAARCSTGYSLRSTSITCVNASPHTSRYTAHDSGPVGFARPSPWSTRTTYSLPVSRRTTRFKTLPASVVGLF